MRMTIGRVHGNGRHVGSRLETTIWRSTVGLIVTLAVGIFVAPLTAEAQQLTKVYRVGWLHPGSWSSTLEPFRQSLRELGYLEGQNLVLEYRYTEGRDERLADLATELVGLQVDVIVAVGVAGNRAAQYATRTIPIVMAGIADPVAQGFVASLTRPGGNITGLATLNEALPGKRLELLKETVPQSARIAVLTNPTHELHGLWMNNLTVATRTLGLQLHVAELRSPEELDSAFTAMTQAGADALVVLSDPVLLAKLYERTVDLAAKHRLPAMYDQRYYMDAGGLMYYGLSQPDRSRSVAVYVDKILKGAKPADLPVETPWKFELVFNLKAATALGLTMPPTVLFQADEVIK
jgi:putative ABC transport system substrate-binding protein